MKLTCPHCSQPLELTPDVLASLQGQPHFECPSCQGLIAVPAQSQRPMPRRPQPQASAAASQAQHGMNRNLLVLGVVALLVLGGIAAFLASRNGGSIMNIFQNTTNNIIHNNYFTQLIASGATTLEDLKSIEEIRPYGDGFIGISKARLDWRQAQDLARRTGARLAQCPQTVSQAGKERLNELVSLLPQLGNTSVWARHGSQPAVLAKLEKTAASDPAASMPCLLAWNEPVLDVDFAKSDLPVFLRNDGKFFKTQIREGRCELRLMQGGLWWPEQPALNKLELVNFECEVEARFPMHCNGTWGIGLIRTEAPKHPWIGIQFDPKGQLEIRPYPNKPVVPSMPTRAHQAGGDWNRVRVVAEGPQISVFINDELVVETQQEGRLSPNALTLFLTAGKDPVEIWFRKIRVWHL